MAYALESVLKIRLTREDRASVELTTARNATREAMAREEERRRELEEFLRHKDERRDRVYEAVMGRKIKMSDLERVNEAVARIDQEGNLRENNVQRAKEEVARREDEEKVARGHYIAAARDRMKIDEHRHTWIAEETAEAEHRQEIELEDFMGRKTTDDRDDADSRG